jgi:multidrug efflux pump
MATDTVLFEKKPVWQSLATLSFPMIISQLVTLVYNLADTYFIGRTGNPYMVAAASLVLPVYSISVAVSNLIGTGGGTLISRLLGARREDEARRVSSAGLYLALILAAVYCIICLVTMDPLLVLLGASDKTIGYARQYAMCIIVFGGIPTVASLTLANFLRSIGRSKESGFGISLGGILNLGLDPLFMFVILPKGDEVAGAGIATALSNLIATLYFVIIIARSSGSSVLTLSPRAGLPAKDSFASLFAVGVPAALTTFLYDLVNIMIDKLSASHGDIAVAAIGIVLKAERLPLNVGIGICQGMVPLVAYNYAAGNFKRMKETIRDTRIAGISFALFSLLMYEIFAGQIMQLFINDSGTVALGTQFMRARCVAAPMMFICFTFLFFFQAVGMGSRSLICAVIRQLVFNIPILIVLDRFFGMNGIIWTQLAADTCTAIASYFIYRSAVS